MQWISVDEKTPDLLDGENHSKTVWATDGNQIYIMQFCCDSDGFVWANCYGCIFDEGEWDDDYKITHWMPIDIPKLPNIKIKATEDVMPEKHKII